MDAAETVKAGRLPGLDALRGIAIVLVLLRHSWPTVFAGAGIVGVVMFFALSGYLITGLLRRELASTGKISLLRFARGRFIRLFPALGLMLAVYWTIETIFNPLGDREIATQTVLAALFYLRDFPLPFATSPAINTLWTLAVEEQFYLFWPLVLTLASSARKLRLTLVGLTVALVLVSTTSVLIFIRDPATVYILPTTWASSLVIGAAAAVYRQRLRARMNEWSPLCLRVSLVLASVVLLALCLAPGAKNQAWIYIVGGPIVASVTVLVIMVAEKWRVPSRGPLHALRLLGLVSYGVYLWNAVMLNWMLPLGPMSALLSIAATLAMAVVSWFTVERLGRKLSASIRQRSSMPDRTRAPARIL